MVTRYKLGIQYVGTKYSGVSINASAPLPTINQKLQQALTKFCKKGIEFDNLTMSSRSGLHCFFLIFIIIFL
jgi:tRNA U38,U39,U40 pseudouridine synthase TruA